MHVDNTYLLSKSESEITSIQYRMLLISVTLKLKSDMLTKMQSN